MATTFKWATPETIASALTTGLNTLADGSTALSGTITNEADQYEFIELELVLASVNLSGSTNPGAAIWFVQQIDGTNYEDGSAGTPGTIPAKASAVFIPVNAVNAAQRVIIPRVELPDGDFKILLLSKFGATLAASANTLKYRRYNEQGV